MLFKPKHIKPDEKWDTTLNSGRGGLSFVEIQRFCGICPKTFETDCRFMMFIQELQINYKKYTQILFRNWEYLFQIHIHRGVDTAMNTYFIVQILYSIKNNIFNIYIPSLIADSTTVSLRAAFHQSAYAVIEFQGAMFYIYINFETFLRSNIVKKLYFLVVLNAL